MIRAMTATMLFSLILPLAAFAGEAPGDSESDESTPSNFGAKGYCEIGGDSQGFDHGSRLSCSGHASGEDDSNTSPPLAPEMTDANQDS